MSDPRRDEQFDNELLAFLAAEAGDRRGVRSAAEIAMRISPAPRAGTFGTRTGLSRLAWLILAGLLAIALLGAVLIGVGGRRDSLAVVPTPSPSAGSTTYAPIFLRLDDGELAAIRVDANGGETELLRLPNANLLGNNPYEARSRRAACSPFRARRPSNSAGNRRPGPNQRRSPSSSLAPSRPGNRSCRRPPTSVLTMSAAPSGTRGTSSRSSRSSSSRRVIRAATAGTGISRSWTAEPVTPEGSTCRTVTSTSCRAGRRTGRGPPREPSDGAGHRRPAAGRHDRSQIPDEAWSFCEDIARAGTDCQSPDRAIVVRMPGKVAPSHGPAFEVPAAPWAGWMEVPS